MIVVDASLAAKWISWEADTRDALRFLSRHGRDLHAPDIVFTEVAQVIVRRANESRAEGKNIDSDALEALRKWTVAWGDHVLRPHRVTQRRNWAAGQLAIAMGHPLKDCIYLVLAMELNCALATCDAKFRTKALPHYSNIKLLSEYAAAG